MKRKIQIAAFSFAAACLACGAEPMEFPEKADWGDAPGIKALEGDVLELGKGVIFSTETFRVDPGKTTVLTGEFRTLPGKKARLFFAFSPYDAGKKPITALNVNIVKGTDTELVAPVKKDDLIVKAKDASRFIPGTVIVFNTKEDFSDLPNRARSHGFFKSAEKQADGTWNITLQAKAAGEYPAGTKIRAHAGGGYQYAVIADLDGSWKTFSGSVKGMAKSGLGGKEWRPGSAYAKVVIFGNAKDAPIQFRNVKVDVRD